MHGPTSPNPFSVEAISIALTTPIALGKVARLEIRWKASSCRNSASAESLQDLGSCLLRKDSDSGPYSKPGLGLSYGSRQQDKDLGLM